MPGRSAVPAEPEPEPEVAPSLTAHALYAYAKDEANECVHGSEKALTPSRISFEEGELITGIEQVDEGTRAAALGSADADCRMVARDERGRRVWSLPRFLRPTGRVVIVHPTLAFFERSRAAQVESSVCAPTVSDGSSQHKMVREQLARTARTQMRGRPTIRRSLDSLRCARALAHSSELWLDAQTSRRAGTRRGGSRVTARGLARHLTRARTMLWPCSLASQTSTGLTSAARRRLSARRAT